MRYLSWATFYEGPTDALYLDVLLPRVMRDLVEAGGTDLVEVPDVPAVKLGTRNRAVESVAAEACAFQDAFDVIFIHADTGGRGLERGLANRSDAYCSAIFELCRWPSEHCVTITPRHETEAWLLGDSLAVTGALGYNGDPQEVGLPAGAPDAERLIDPKLTLSSAVEAVAGRRRRQSLENLFPAIAQRQRLDELRKAGSFAQFEARLQRCLQSRRLVH